MNVFNPENFRGVRYRFENADRVYIRAFEYRFMRSNTEGVWLQRADGDFPIEFFAHSVIGRMLAVGQLKVQRAIRSVQAPTSPGEGEETLSNLTGRLRAEIRNRHIIVLAFQVLLDEGLIKRTEASINANRLILDQRIYQIASARKSFDTQPSETSSGVEVPAPRAPSTILRLERAYRKHGLIGLVDSRSRSGNRGGYFTVEERQLLEDCARLYCSPQRPTKILVFEQTKVRFGALNKERAKEGLTPLRVPSREAVRAEINRLDRFEVDVARMGKDWVRRKLAPVGKGLEVTRPLERVEVDEFKIDLIALCIAMRRRDFFTDEEWSALGLDGERKRWWLSVAIDCASRCVLAARLSRKPTTEGALATLEMAILDKSAWSDAAGTRSRWIQHGSPETLVTDCGGPYLTDAFEAAAQDLGVTVLRTVAGKPDQRGRIERFFRTLILKLLPKLPGRTFASVVEREGHPSKERAALTIDDLTRVLVLWLVDVYHNSPHAGLGGQTPLDAWDELVERWGVLPPPDLRARRLAFGRRLSRKVQRTGIQVLGVTYSSEALQRWRLHSRKHDVSVRWHPGDLGAIEVKFDGAWREVPAVIDGFHGRTAQEWVAATRQIRASNQNRARVREDVVLQAFADIDSIAGAAASRADILVHDWSSDRISGLEDRLFIGFEIAPTPAMEAPEPIGPKALLGTVIPVGGDGADEVSVLEDELPKAASSADADIDDEDSDDDWGIER